jgi:NAD(P)-dependent dehydrogenase (short-subunit alcohol dehydrogenase family)
MQRCFYQSLAKQLAEKGIRVNAVAPGLVWTPLQVTGRTKTGGAEIVRRANSIEASRTARRASADLCDAGRVRTQFRNRTGIRQLRREWESIKAGELALLKLEQIGLVTEKKDRHNTSLH